ncbi:MAG: PilZ domain-containing protein [Actinobacteria bacterium]|nr:PilZ domain-containing protein [Actinomycetota bacterium]
MTGSTIEIRAPRAQIALGCTLRRRIGSPISAETLDVGPRGMRIRSPRPLMADETIGFDLPDLDMRLNGRARVITEECPHVYALRFEGLPEPMVRRLHALAISAR